MVRTSISTPAMSIDFMFRFMQTGDISSTSWVMSPSPAISFEDSRLNKIGGNCSFYQRTRVLVTVEGYTGQDLSKINYSSQIRVIFKNTHIFFIRYVLLIQRWNM